jgi:hypothetical protein
MKTTLKLVIFLFGIIGIAAFCCKRESTSFNNSHFGESFLLKMNESTSITSSIPDESNNDSSLTVSFKKVINDSRCPKVSCDLCYGSAASIKVLLTFQKDTTSIVLTILGCRDEYTCDDQLYYRKDTLGYRICLLRLDPYPDGNINIDLHNYIAKLNISKL